MRYEWTINDIKLTQHESEQIAHGTLLRISLELRCSSAQIRLAPERCAQLKKL